MRAHGARDGPHQASEVGADRMWLKVRFFLGHVWLFGRSVSRFWVLREMTGCGVGQTASIVSVEDNIRS